MNWLEFDISLEHVWEEEMDGEGNPVGQEKNLLYLTISLKWAHPVHGIMSTPTKAFYAKEKVLHIYFIKHYRGRWNQCDCAACKQRYKDKRNTGVVHMLYGNCLKRNKPFKPTILMVFTYFSHISSPEAKRSPENVSETSLRRTGSTSDCIRCALNTIVWSFNNEINLSGKNMIQHYISIWFVSAPVLSMLCGRLEILVLNIDSLSVIKIVRDCFALTQLYVELQYCSWMDGSIRNAESKSMLSNGFKQATLCQERRWMSLHHVMYVPLSAEHKQHIPALSNSRPDWWFQQRHANRSSSSQKMKLFLCDKYDHLWLNSFTAKGVIENTIIKARQRRFWISPLHSSAFPCCWIEMLLIWNLRPLFSQMTMNITWKKPWDAIRVPVLDKWCSVCQQRQDWEKEKSLHRLSQD